MLTQPSFEPARSAMLSMDYQTAIVSLYAQDQAGLLERARSVLNGARSSGMAVVHVRVGFRPNLPEVSPRNLLLNAIKSNDKWRQMFEGDAGAIHSEVAPEANDIIITKHRVGAFAGTDLDLILRAQEIDTLILFGIATSGAVLSTLLHAADADYRLIVIKDCCADLDRQVHDCLVDKILPRQAAVMTASEFLEILITKGVKR